MLTFDRTGKQVLDRKWCWIISNLLLLAKTYLPNVLPRTTAAPPAREKPYPNTRACVCRGWGTMLITFLVVVATHNTLSRSSLVIAGVEEGFILVRRLQVQSIMIYDI